ELPGLMAASVWITLVISRPLAVGSLRLSALMMPVVSDWSRPNGLPMANTDWPTFRSSEVPIAIGGGGRRGLSTRRTPRAWLGAGWGVGGRKTWPEGRRTGTELVPSTT